MEQKKLGYKAAEAALDVLYEFAKLSMKDIKDSMRVNANIACDCILYRFVYATVGIVYDMDAIYTLTSEEQEMLADKADKYSRDLDKFKEGK